MADLTTGALNSIAQSGEVGRLFGSNSAAELRTASEMQAQGMEMPGAAQAPGGTTFLDVLKQSVEKVNLDQVQADTAVKELVAGRSKNIHETMLAVEKADASLKLMMQVRNKILDAYKEIMRMQV